MFNPEKLLGGLIQGGVRRRSGLGGILSGGAALGLVGVAMEAMEHYMNRSQNTTRTAGPPPVAPPSGTRTVPSAVPPPPPTSEGVGQPPPPPQATADSDPAQATDPQKLSEAVLLIRAMIAAANADGVIDETERQAILDKLKTVNLSEDEREFLLVELLAPKEMEQIAGAVTSEAMACQVYTVSLMAIEVDTALEREYLHGLAQRLNLDPATIQTIHQKLGLV